MIETIFTAGGLGLVVWVIADMLKPSKKTPTPPAPPAAQPFSMNQAEIQGTFDAVALQRARHMMTVIKGYPDDQSKVLALAHELHRDRAREMNQVERQGQDLQQGLTALKGLMEVVSPIIGNQQRQIPVNNHPNPWERY